MQYSIKEELPVLMVTNSVAVYWQCHDIFKSNTYFTVKHANVTHTLHKSTITDSRDEN